MFDVSGRAAEVFSWLLAAPAPFVGAGLVNALSQTLIKLTAPGIPDLYQGSERGDPLGQMKLSSRAKAQAVQRDATALLTACGLALRSFD